MPSGIAPSQPGIGLSTCLSGALPRILNKYMQMCLWLCHAHNHKLILVVVYTVSGQQHAPTVEKSMRMCLWLCLLCVNVRAFAASVPSSSSPSSPAASTKAFSSIFDSTLRPTSTTGEHTAPSCPQNNQNCLQQHCHININFIFTHIYMSLSVNQVEAPSHIEVVCFGNGAIFSRGQSGLLVCARIPQRPCIRE